MFKAPLIPRRIAANARKRAIIDGTFGSFTPNVGGVSLIMFGYSYFKA